MSAQERAHRWAEWIAQAPEFPWRDRYGVEPFGDVPLPQPLVAAPQVARLTGRDGPGFAAFLGAAWTLPDAVVAASVLDVRGLLTDDPVDAAVYPDLVLDWPLVVSAYGHHRFDRCRAEGCLAPVYSQSHLRRGGRPPMCCLWHTDRQRRAFAALGRDRAAIESWLGPLSPVRAA